MFRVLAVMLTGCVALAVAAEDGSVVLEANNLLQNRFELLADVVAACPLDGQEETITFMGALWRHLTAKGAFDAGRAEALAAQSEQTLVSLKRTLPFGRARWADDELSWVEPPAPVPLAAGLERFLLVEVANEGQAPVQVDPNPGRPRRVAAALTAIPARGARVRLVRVLTEDVAAETVTFTLFVDGQPRTLAVPVTVSPAARLTGRVLHGATGESFPGRVYARGADGIYRHGEAYADNPTVSEKQILLVVEAGKNYRLPFFYSDGAFAVAVPSGPTEVRLERGFESNIVATRIDLAPGGSGEVSLVTERVIDMAALGWVSGDTHVHWAKNWWNEDEDIDLLAIVQRAEDLRVVNNLTLRHQNPPQPEFINPAQFPMGPVPGHYGPDYKIVMGEEYRNQPFYGHLNFLNVKELIQPIATGDLMGEEALDWPLNRPAVAECYRQGGISTEAHGLGAEGAANIIDGYASAIDQANPGDYYRVLNAGMRIALGNGSDHPARIAGCARTYVRQEDPASYAEWIDGVRAARTFTTSGPLLFLDVNGVDVGDELQVAAGDVLRITARAWSRRPIGRLQVVVDGEVAGEAVLPGREGGVALELPATRSGWVVARCSRTPNFSAIFEPDVAHTSAVYVVVDGRPILRPEAARTLARQLRHHAQYIRDEARFENDQQREAAARVSLEGADAYDRLADEGGAALSANPSK